MFKEIIISLLTLIYFVFQPRGLWRGERCARSLRALRRKGVSSEELDIFNPSIYQVNFFFFFHNVRYLFIFTCDTNKQFMLQISDH